MDREKISQKFNEIRKSECLGCFYDSLSQKDHECMMRYVPGRDCDQYKRALQFFVDRGELHPTEAKSLYFDYCNILCGI